MRKFEANTERMATVALDIYSPRWGHKDRYVIKLSAKQLHISMGARSCVCTWSDIEIPSWNGSLQEIFENDGICSPSNFNTYLVYAWEEWKKCGLDDQSLNNELQKLVDWLNTINLSRPNTNFWSDVL